MSLSVDLAPAAVMACVWIPMVAAPIAWAIRRRSAKWGDNIVTLLCLIILALAGYVFVCGTGTTSCEKVFLLGISFSYGGFRSLFALLCSFMFLLSSLANESYFEGEPHTERYSAFLLLTLGGIMGVFYSGDLFTTYVFFEIMSIASWVWVAHNETPQAQRASDTYLAMAMAGGFVMLYGLIGLNHALGTLDISLLPQAVSQCANKGYIFAMTICLLIGFGVKAGMYPFHVWLPKAHPVAPAPASALLSGILTKSGIFGILVTIIALQWGNERYTALLLALGCVTMILGAVLAVFSNDLKRTLACSSLSQIGFILVGCAMLAAGRETDLAAGGIMLHALNHGLIKTVLFLSAGVIYKNRHTLDLNSLKGSGRGSWFVAVCFAVGALCISGVPGFGGYVSKTLLHESIVENIHLSSASSAAILEAVEWVFLISGGLTAAYMTKLFVKLFIEKSNGSTKPLKTDLKTKVALFVPSVMLIIMGVFPHITYDKIAAFTSSSLNSSSFSVRYFSIENLKGAAISLAIGAAVYFLFIRLLMTDHRTGDYKQAVPIIDIEEDIYRPLVDLLAFVGALFARIAYSATDWLVALISRIMRTKEALRVTPGENGHFGRYSRQYVSAGAISQTLQFELMLFGVGVIIVLVCLLFL